jgi:flagellar hook-associated protein 2
VFNNLVPGVNVTVKEAGASVINVNVTPDTDALATKVKAMVDAYNAARSEMATQSKYDQTTKVAGPLNGQPSIRSALTQLGNAVIGDEFTNLGVAGISLDRSGNLTFDAAKFNQAYSSDPAATRALFTDPATGFAKRMGDALEGLTNIAGGVLTSGQDALKSQVRDLDTRIAAYETRLTKREETLRRQFTSMDTRIATMQQQFARFQSQLGAG